MDTISDHINAALRLIKSDYPGLASEELEKALVKVDAIERANLVALMREAKLAFDDSYISVVAGYRTDYRLGHPVFSVSIYLVAKEKHFSSCDEAMAWLVANKQPAADLAIQAGVGP